MVVTDTVWQAALEVVRGELELELRRRAREALVEGLQLRKGDKGLMTAVVEACERQVDVVGGEEKRVVVRLQYCAATKLDVPKYVVDDPDSADIVDRVNDILAGIVVELPLDFPVVVVGGHVHTLKGAAETIASKLGGLTDCLATCVPLGEAGCIVVEPATELVRELRRLLPRGTPEGVTLKGRVCDIFE